MKAMSRYNCTRATITPRTKKMGFTSSGMVYLSPEGKKVTTPNDKRVEAEIKNRSEAMRLEFYKKQLEKEKMRGKFLIKMEQKQAISALKVMMETSGHSPVSEPPRGPKDTEHETSPYFTGPTRMSMRKLVRWRTEEKEVQRMLREKEGAKPPPPDISRNAGYYKDFLEMINSLGLTHSEDPGDDIVIPPVLPDPAVSQEEKEIGLQKKAPQDMKCPSSSRHKIRIDVFQCLKNDLQSAGEQGKEIKKSPVLERKYSRSIRGKSAPPGTFSVRQWQKEMTENYLKSVSRPGSAQTLDQDRDDAHETNNIIKTHSKKTFRMRPSSAPVRMKFSKRQLPTTPEVCECDVDVHYDSDSRRRGSLPENSTPGIQIFMDSELKSSSNGNRPHRKTGNRGNSTQQSSSEEKDSKLKSARRKLALELNKNKTQLTKNCHIVPQSRVTEGDKLEPRPLQILDKRILDKKASNGVVSASSGRPMKCSVAFDIDIEENCTTGQKVSEEGNEDLVEENDEECLEEDANRVTRWKRDLSAEAPPSVFSTKIPVKVQLALSKLERQRVLEKMVQEHTFAIAPLVKREKVRRVRQRLKAVATMEKVQDAAVVAKKKLGRPRNDQDILRDIDNL